MENLTTFTTSDLALAATLCVSGYQLIAIEPRPERPSHAAFVFDEVDRQVLNDYDMDKLRVEPKAIANKMRHLTGAARKACGSGRT